MWVAEWANIPSSCCKRVSALNLGFRASHGSYDVCIAALMSRVVDGLASDLTWPKDNRNPRFKRLVVRIWVSAKGNGISEFC